MKFCSSCGSEEITQKVPKGDNRMRYVCPKCDEIFYHNPKIVAGCIAEWQGKILMCKRAIEPQHGKWTLPAGFMENQETMHAAAARETREEATAEVKNLRLYTMYNLPHISQVYVMYLGEMIDGVASPGIESLEVALMDESEIPWEEIAFPVIKETLELYFQDKNNSSGFDLHYGDMTKLADKKLDIKRY